MFLQNVILAVVVLPYVLGYNSTVLDVNSNISKTNASVTIHPKFFNEGGAASPEDPSLSKGNDLLSLNKETSKIKKTSSVVRKNGVNFMQDQLGAMKIGSISKQYNTSESKEVHKNIVSTKNIANKTLNYTNAASKTVIHKPLILSYEALSKMDKNQNKLSSLPIIQSSSKPVSDQVPSPNEDTNKFKSYTMNSVKHPGMIMPIVITILVVPMFAVLGYMAVKRGKEAWKNRHYKRMDFLLDGMYND